MQCDAGCPEAASRGKACSCKVSTCTGPAQAHSLSLDRIRLLTDPTPPRSAAFSRFHQFPVSLAAVSSIPCCRRIPQVPYRTVTTHNTPIPYLSPPSSPMPHVHVPLLLLPPFSLLFCASPPFWERDVAFDLPIAR